MHRAGDLLEGRYELEAQLGQGGTALVFRACDLVTKATVAIKVMEAGREQDPEAVAYFSQEGRLAARIRDPHLVPALHFGVDEGRHFIVYDYLPGTRPLSRNCPDTPRRARADVVVRTRRDRRVRGLQATRRHGVRPRSRAGGVGS